MAGIELEDEDERNKVYHVRLIGFQCLILNILVPSGGDVVMGHIVVVNVHRSPFIAIHIAPIFKQYPLEFTTYTDR